MGSEDMRRWEPDGAKLPFENDEYDLILPPSIILHHDIPKDGARIVLARCSVCDSTNWREFIWNDQNPFPQRCSCGRPFLHSEENQGKRGGRKVGQGNSTISWQEMQYKAQRRREAGIDQEWTARDFTKDSSYVGSGDVSVRANW